MKYVVQPGDTLSKIARDHLGDAKRWPELSKLNRITNADHILIGSQLVLPHGAKPQSTVAASHTPGVAASHTLSKDRLSAMALGGHYAALLPIADRPARTIPLRAFFFVLADEVNPFARKVVRKVMFPKGLNDAALAGRIMHPELHGFTPRDPLSPVSLGRHVLGRTDSRFISASERPLGSSRFGGKRYWIDVEKAKAGGATLHETDAILKDLERVSKKTKDPRFKSYIEEIRSKVQAVDHEVAFEGRIPPGAVKTAGGMAATRGLQFVEGVGIAMSVYDLSKAGVRSYREDSVKPIAAESVRQAGGWGGAWAGAELCGTAGAALGIETGPGAIVTGAVGGLIGGVAGFFGADWIAHLIDHGNGAQ
jgi:LysM domain